METTVHAITQSKALFQAEKVVWVAGVEMTILSTISIKEEKEKEGAAAPTSGLPGFQMVPTLEKLSNLFGMYCMAVQ